MCLVEAGWASVILGLSVGAYCLSFPLLGDFADAA